MSNMYALMVISAANNVKNNAEALDAMNVFPVPDGDTGKNMCMTMNGACMAAQAAMELSLKEAAEQIAVATLKSARGNSGVILSQLFRGMSAELKKVEQLSPMAMAKALMAGAITAYAAVVNPVEGTILTVAKESAKAALALENANSLEEVLFATLGQAKISLEQTPKLLPKLKAAGVVDAGGQGWVYVLEGMLHAVKTGSAIDCIQNQEEVVQDIPLPEKEQTQEDIRFTYCTEFIINKPEDAGDCGEMKAEIEPMGDSLVWVNEEALVKVHIHTDNPGLVIEKALTIGEIEGIKIDNMRAQLRQKLNSKPKKPYAFVVVSAGAGFSDIFGQIGADVVVEGGQTMNPSAGDLLLAVQSIRAEVIYLLPNNKNVILAAHQAQELYDGKLIVIPTSTVTEGISALLAFDEAEDASCNLQIMEEALRQVKTASVTWAVRDSKVGRRVIKQGDIIGLAGDNILAKGSKPAKVAFELVKNMITDNSGIVTIYSSAEISEQENQWLQSHIQKAFPAVDISMQFGGQPVYYYIISIE